MQRRVSVLLILDEVVLVGYSRIGHRLPATSFANTELSSEKVRHVAARATNVGGAGSAMHGRLALFRASVKTYLR